jgi:hypothetical protein
VIEAFTSILIVLIIGSGAYYASLQFVQLRHNRDTLADEYKRAEGHIRDLEDRVMMLEAQMESNRPMPRASGDDKGWGTFEPRR